MYMGLRDGRAMDTLAEFEDHVRAACGSERTVFPYTTDAREFIAFLGGRTADIDAVEQWAASLNHRRCKPQTVGRKMAAVRRLLGYVARHGDEAAAKTLAILHDYKVTPAVREADLHRRRAVNEVEYRTAMARATPRDAALMTLLWWTGCRIDDAVAGIPPITVGDARALVTDRAIITSGKGGKRRVLVLPSRGGTSYAATWRLLRPRRSHRDRCSRSRRRAFTRCCVGWACHRPTPSGMRTGRS
jgi:site-specific recombinase XerD